MYLIANKELSYTGIFPGVCLLPHQSPALDASPLHPCRVNKPSPLHQYQANAREGTLPLTDAQPFSFSLQD